MRGLGSRHLQSPCAWAHLLAPTEQLWGTAAAGARGRGRSLGTQGCSSSEGTRPDRRHRHSSRQEPQPQEGCCKITSAESALRLPPGAVNNPTASLCPPAQPHGDVWLRSALLESPPRSLEDAPGALHVTWGKIPLGCGWAQAAREQLLKSIPVLSLSRLPRGPPAASHTGQTRGLLTGKPPTSCWRRHGGDRAARPQSDALGFPSPHAVLSVMTPPGHKT